MAVQVLRHAAAAVRGAQRHDAPWFPPRMIMKQGADQDATEAMARQVHGIGVERIEETRQPRGIGMEIGADRGIGK